VPSEPSEFLVSRDININWPQVKLKKLRLAKGIASQRRRLQILLMVSLPDIEKPKCLGVCYSKAFFVRSHQNQLVMNQRNQLGKSTAEGVRRESTTEGMMRENSNFFISNVGIDQIQDRNLMGEVGGEGRYPILHINGIIFKDVLLPACSKFYIDVKLVIPKEGQLCRLASTSIRKREDT
jgi:hypothetical protein